MKALLMTNKSLGLVVAATIENKQLINVVTNNKAAFAQVCINAIMTQNEDDIVGVGRICSLVNQLGGIQEDKSLTKEQCVANVKKEDLI